MGLFASTLCVTYASTLWNSIHAITASIIAKTGLRPLSNFWSQRNYSSLWTLTKTELLCGQTQPTDATIKKEICSVGATSDCRDWEICVSLLNENTLTTNQGILQILHENLGPGQLWQLVINELLYTLILSRHRFSSNILLVKHG